MKKAPSIFVHSAAYLWRALTSPQWLIFVAACALILTLAHHAHAGTVGDPVSGTPVNLNSAPGSSTIIEAEGFDKGGQRIAAFSPDPRDCTSAAPCYCTQSMRAGEGIGVCGSTPAFVTNTAAGTWLDYTIWVAAHASYTIALNVAFKLIDCPVCKDAAYHVELDGIVVADTTALGPTGMTNWVDFQWRGETAPFPISPGQHVLRVVIDKPAFNFDSLRVRYAQDTTAVWNGYAWVPIVRVFPAP